MIKKALEPYCRLLANAQDNLNHNPVVVLQKSKDAYLRLIDIKCSDILTTDMCPVVTEYCDIIGMSVDDAFRNQLCSKIEIKLKEFNFKVMYNILPCNANLKKWRKMDNDTCDICNSKQTIEHLLFTCHRASYLWKLVTDIFHCDVTFGNIVCGFEKCAPSFCHTTTLLAFLLYKEWLLCSLDKKQRCFNFPYHFFIVELQLRDKIYKCNGMDINLIPVIEYLTGKVDE